MSIATTAHQFFSALARESIRSRTAAAPSRLPPTRSKVALAELTRDRWQVIDEAQVSLGEITWEGGQFRIRHEGDAVASYGFATATIALSYFQEYVEALEER